MKLYYYKEDVPNFGDDLNHWIWDKILPGTFDNDSSHLVLGIGSILNDKLPRANKYTILGSGWGYGDAPIIDEKWDVLCVRGKLTCRELGISEDKAVIDPAYLLSDFFPTKLEKKYKISMIPHAVSMEVGHWDKVCEELDINLIDIRTDNIKKFVEEIKSSEKVLTEAMHGAIVADCFGVPWKGFSAYDHINSTKWNDWLSVFGVQTDLEKVPSLYKGYCGMNLLSRIKNEIKHVMLKFRRWDSSWDLPKPRKTSHKEFLQICEKIKELTATPIYELNDRELVRQQIEKLNKIIGAFK